jgi:hypothetical protein
LLGLEPSGILDKGHTDYLISVAVLQKALELTSDNKIEEIKILAELIGLEVGKTLAKIF